MGSRDASSTLGPPSPKPRPMIQLCRIHAYKAGIFQLFDVPLREATKLRETLIANGFVISHTETV